MDKRNAIIAGLKRAGTTLAAKLLNADSAWWEYYSKESVEALLG